MVYLVCDDINTINHYISFIKAEKITYTVLSWDKLPIIASGFFIIVECKMDAARATRIRELARNRVQILLLTDTGMEELRSIHNLLILPGSTDISILRPLIFWMLYNNSVDECFVTLRSLFFEQKYQVFFLDEKGIILYSLPEEDSFLGCRGRYFIARSFKDIFGLPETAIPVLGDQKEQDTYKLITSKKQLKINIVKLPCTQIKIPGVPAATENIIFLIEVDSGSRENAALRFSLIEEKEPALQIRQKAIELLITNEIHHKQVQKLRNTYEQLNIRNKQILEELSLASDLQKSLLPRRFPLDIPLNFTHKYLPYTYIGGDFFDIIPLDKNKIGIMIADASGHGVSAAFITAMFKSTVNHFKDFHLEPAQLMQALNKEFSETIHTEHYITAFYAVLDMDDMKCTYCNAGHPRQLLIRKEGECMELTTDGFFIGMFKETEYIQKEINLFPGDRLFFFTDGILEITNSKQELFGRKNITKTVTENKHLDIENLSNVLMSTLVMYMEDITFKDDITILITEVIDTI